MRELDLRLGEALEVTAADADGSLPPRREAQDEQLRPQATLDEEVAAPDERPGTTLTATLVRSWYGERVVGPDAGASAAAEVTVRAADGRTETVIMPFFRARTVLGTRLYLDGGRAAIFLFVVP